MLGAGVGSRGKMQKVSPKLKKFPGGKKIARKEMPMTMNEDERGRSKFSRTSLQHISWICWNSRSTCRNIWRVRAEYVRSHNSVRAFQIRGYGPGKPRARFYRRTCKFRTTKKIRYKKKAKKTTQKIETVKYKVLFDHIFSDRNYSKVYIFLRYTISPSNLTGSSDYS